MCYEESRVDRIERGNAEREIRFDKIPKKVKEAIEAFRNLSTHYPPDHPDTDIMVGDLIKTGLILSDYITK